MATAYNDTIFSDYHPKGNHINPSLLWEYDMNTFDWQRSKTIVVQRVVELGWPEDFYGAFDLYGGFEGFREIIKTIPHLSDIDTFLLLGHDHHREACLTYLASSSQA